MTKDEYKEKIAKIAKIYDLEQYKIMKEYVLSNNPYKIDDIFQDHIGKIQIKKIKVHYKFLPDFPLCCYDGIIINKDGSFCKKKDNKRIAYLCNEIKGEQYV